MIEISLNNFIKPQYCERLLYELKSSKTNKRDEAFTKLVDYNEYFLENLSKIDLTHKSDQEIISIINDLVILRGVFPFEIELPKNNNEEYTNLAMIIESTAGNGKVSEKNQNILNLYSSGQIDYETAVFAIKRSFINE